MTGKALEATGEQITVNTAQVDSINGAKPEPEERPAEILTFLDPKTGERANPGRSALVPETPHTIRQEVSVNDLSVMLGKVCRNCLHFNHPLGQAMMQQEMSSGSPDRVDYWRNVIAELAVRNGMEGDELVADVFAETPAEREVLKLGFCMALSEKENTWTHPDGFCPSMEVCGMDLFKPRTSEIERTIQQMRDKLYGVASVK